MTRELFHRIHCGAMQYSFESKTHFVLVTFNGRVVFRSIGCLRSATPWVRKIRSEKSSEREARDCLDPASPTAQVLIISGGVVTPQPDSSSHWSLCITWPAVSIPIGCRQTTCGFSPPLCKLCCEFDPLSLTDISPPGVIMPSIIISRYTTDPWLTSVSSWSECRHVTAVLTSVRCLLIPQSPVLSPPARPESPCAPPGPGLSPITSGCRDNNNTVLTCCCSARLESSVSTTGPGDSRKFWSIMAVLILVLFSINLKLYLQIKFRRIVFFNLNLEEN